MAEHSARGQVEQGSSHPSLQETMLDHAREYGTVIHRPATLVDIAPGPNGLTVNFERGELTQTLVAGIVLGADGTLSKSRSLIGIATNRNRLHHWFAGVLIDGFGGDPDRRIRPWSPAVDSSYCRKETAALVLISRSCRRELRRSGPTDQAVPCWS